MEDFKIWIFGFDFVEYGEWKWLLLGLLMIFINWIKG